MGCSRFAGIFLLCLALRNAYCAELPVKRNRLNDIIEPLQAHLLENAESLFKDFQFLIEEPKYGIKYYSDGNFADVDVQIFKEDSFVTDYSYFSLVYIKGLSFQWSHKSESHQVGFTVTLKANFTMDDPPHFSHLEIVSVIFKDEFLSTIASIKKSAAESGSIASGDELSRRMATNLRPLYDVLLKKRNTKKDVPRIYDIYEEFKIDSKKLSEANAIHKTLGFGVTYILNVEKEIRKAIIENVKRILSQEFVLLDALRDFNKVVPEIIEVLHKHKDVKLVSDEIYNAITFSEFRYLFGEPDFKERTVDVALIWKDVVVRDFEMHGKVYRGTNVAYSMNLKLTYGTMGVVQVEVASTGVFRKSRADGDRIALWLIETYAKTVIFKELSEHLVCRETRMQLWMSHWLQDFSIHNLQISHGVQGYKDVNLLINSDNKISINSVLRHGFDLHHLEWFTVVIEFGKGISVAGHYVLENHKKEIPLQQIPVKLGIRVAIRVQSVHSIKLIWPQSADPDLLVIIRGLMPHLKEQLQLHLQKRSGFSQKQAIIELLDECRANHDFRGNQLSSYDDIIIKDNQATIKFAWKTNQQADLHITNKFSLTNWPTVTFNAVFIFADNFYDIKELAAVDNFDLEAKNLESEDEDAQLIIFDNIKNHVSKAFGLFIEVSDKVLTHQVQTGNVEKQS